MQINSVPILWETQIRTITTDREVDGMRFCTKCGAAIVDDKSQFCGECGEKIIKENISQTTTQSTSTTNFSPASNSDGIVLELPTPIPSRIISNSSADNIGSIGATIGVIGFFLQFLQFTDSFYTIGRIGLGILLIGGTLVFINRFLYWTKGRTESKDVKIMRTHLPEIREMKFKFVSGVNAGAIYEKIAPSIKSQYGNKFEFDRQNETVSLIHEKVIYKIILNDDGTFCIWWMNLDNKPLDKISADDLYDVYANVLTCTAIIAYELQQQFGIN